MLSLHLQIFSSGFVNLKNTVKSFLWKLNDYSSLNILVDMYLHDFFSNRS